MGQLLRYVLIIVMVYQINAFEAESDPIGIDDVDAQSSDAVPNEFDAASRSGAFRSQQRPAFCYYDPDKGPCNGRYPRFYYDYTQNICKFFFYGGCGGNPNNFITQTQCMRVCKSYYQ
ncbi:pancreatic trypsin inhibitor-like [Bicyclus anynana]|uniref:Pancreatic trypsin inhibitor-like n=1 Tax=Bicyclus anynana TaxID=110368 RepID=A0ABM3LMP1_BICAN|nr:pancreatic trypsin inhibitor-like [Bicyclus anynana]